MDETTTAPEDLGNPTPASEPGAPAQAEPTGPPAPDGVAPDEAEAGPNDAADPRELPSLPPQYATGGSLGFFTRTTEVVPAAQTVGPDGAIYIAELTGLPYPEGYARVLRVEDPGTVSGFDGQVPSGVAQTYASGFDQIHSLTFDGEGSLFVLEYQVASEVYDPSLAPSDLPPSTLVKVAPDGGREIISGPELKLANYVLADPETGDVYATVNDTEAEDGKVLRYSRDEAGAYDVEVVAEGLESPRGLSFGPDGNLHVLEQGQGTPPSDPGFEDAPIVQLIPGLVAQRGGYSGAITRVDADAGTAERVFEGLPSFQEFDPQTGEDRVFGVGVRGFDIADDGTVWIASGGGLSDATAAAAGEVGQDLRGLLRLEGLFGENPAEATWTEEFDSVDYAGAFGPDGATTLFNTQSNLNDVTVGPDGTLFAVDAARNVLYEIDGSDGETLESVTVLQKRPPVLTPPQFAAVLENGGDPAADYRLEIADRTYKGANALPDTPGRQQALAANGEGPAAPPFDPNFVPPPRGEDAAGSVGDAAGGAGVPGDFSGVGGSGGEPPANLVDMGADAPATSPEGDLTDDAGGENPLPVGVEPGDVLASPDAETPEAPFPAPDETPDGTPVGEIDGATEGGEGGGEITDFDPQNPPELPNVPGPVADGPLLPGPVDPVAPPVIVNNKYAPYFDPFFGTYAPARGLEPELPDGEGDSSKVDQLFVFGDRLTEDGGRYGKVAVAAEADVELPIDEAPYSSFGNFTDGRNWTTYLERILGVAEDDGSGGDDTNFSYLDATARALANPFDPLQGASGGLTNFAGQIDAFEEAYGSFDGDELVVVSFGGNDLTLPPGEGVTPEEAFGASIQATLDGIARLASLGATSFLVPNLVDVEIVPIFSDPAFQEALGVPPGALTEAVTAYNAALEGALGAFEEASGVEVTVLDTNALFADIVAEPEAYGFLQTEEPVLVTLPDVGVEAPVYNPAIVGQDPAVQHATLFLDVLFSPTALAQSIIAETARDALLGRGGEEPMGGGLVATITGTGGEDSLFGTDGRDVIDAGGGRYDRSTGGEGADTFLFGAEAGNGAKDRDVVWDFEAGVDSIRLAEGAAVRSVEQRGEDIHIRLEGDGDAVFIRGEGLTVDNIGLPLDQGDAPIA